MTRAPTNAPLPLTPPDIRQRWGVIVSLSLALLALCAGLTGICRWAAGPTLGLVLGPPALFCIVIPAILSVSGRAIHPWLITMLATLGTALVWFTCLPGTTGTNARQVGLCLIVLASLILLLAAATAALLASGIRPTAGAACITIISLAWLSCPIWLSPHLVGRTGELATGWIVWLHPCFAMNAMLHYDMWDHTGLMYSTLSSLNQDVPYRIPQSIGPSAIVQSAAAIVLLALPLLSRRRRANAIAFSANVR